jgi:DNA-binding LacI/PurR family transcriptional regulator
MRGKDSDEDNGREQTRRLLHDGLPDCGDTPTGIVGFNDWCALGALHGAALEGVRVPEDISVIGFDNTLLGVASSPRMCSYQPKSLQMGSEAMRLLATLIEGVQEAPRRVSVPVDYVSRDSVGPAPESVAGASQSLRVLVNSA